MRRPQLLRRLPSPILTTSLLLLATVAILFWGRTTQVASTPNVAQIPRTHATLANGEECEFAAEVQLAGRWSGFAFSLREGAVRAALIELLRSKSRYMVSTSTAREALRYQMVSAVNGVIGSGRATAIRFTAFELL
jgi:hypothetical protein